MHCPRSRFTALLPFMVTHALVCFSPITSTFADPLATPAVEVFFSPHGDPIESIIREIDNQYANGRR